MSDEPKLIHICEVCGRTETLTPEDAFNAGWDYPPKMGHFGIISPRTCPNCLMMDTVWAALMMKNTPPEDFTAAQFAVIARIQAEPESILP